MEQYIPKSALVAEIKNLIERAEAERVLYSKTILAAKDFLLIEDYKKLLSIIDTIEVKEVVDAEIVEVEDNNKSMYAYTHLEICTDEDLSKICKAGDKAKVIIIKQK